MVESTKPNDAATIKKIVEYLNIYIPDIMKENRFISYKNKGVKRAFKNLKSESE